MSLVSPGSEKKKKRRTKRTRSGSSFCFLYFTLFDSPCFYLRESEPHPLEFAFFPEPFLLRSSPQEQGTHSGTSPSRRKPGAWAFQRVSGREEAAKGAKAKRFRLRATKRENVVLSLCLCLCLSLSRCAARVGCKPQARGNFLSPCSSATKLRESVARTDEKRERERANRKETSAPVVVGHASRPFSLNTSQPRRRPPLSLSLFHPPQAQTTPCAPPLSP